ncbi:MAG: hypothetical protein AAF938_01775 [Myxococcota bacterium]
MRLAVRLSMALFVAASMSACIPDDVSLEGLPCPCVSGFVCVADVCVPEDRADAATEMGVTPDGGLDQGLEGGVEVGPDDSVELGPEAGPDADVGVDAEVGMDAAMDADLRMDANTDVGVDADMGSPLSFCESLAGNDAVLACIDFDTPPEDAGWSVESDGSTEPRFVSDPAVDGRALEVRVGREQFFEYTSLGMGEVASGEMWFRISALINAGDDASTEFVSLVSANVADEPPFRFMSVGLTGLGSVQVAVSASSFESQSSPRRSVPTGRFACIELRMNVQRKGTYQLFVNGGSVATLNADARGPWNRVFAGVGGGDTQNDPVTVIVDNYVWSTERIPCE